jgi:hypothetical protein
MKKFYVVSRVCYGFTINVHCEGRFETQFTCFALKGETGKIFVTTNDKDFVPLDFVTLRIQETQPC